MDDRRLEIKVGILVVGALFAVAGLFFLMSNVRIGDEAALEVHFAHTGNVIRGAPVKLGGIQVGSVETVNLEPGRRDERGDPLPVTMGLSLEERARAVLKADLEIHIATVGPLGEPYLELKPGSSRADALKAGVAVRGTDAIRLELVAANAARFLDSATALLEEDPQALASLVKGIGGLSNTLDTVIRDNQGDVKVVAQEMAQASKDFRLLAQLARKHMEPGGTGAVLLEDARESAALMKRELPGMTADAKTALKSVSAVTGSFTAEDGKSLKLAIQKYSAAGEKLESLATRAERVLAKMEAGEGSIGGLYQDPAVYQDLKTLVSDLKRNPWKVLWKE